MSIHILHDGVDGESKGLALYDEARRALAEAYRVDEVKTIRDKAIGLQHYAQQAKDRQLIEYATEIRLRAEIRAGELLAEMKQRGERHSGHANNPPKKLELHDATPTLTDLGVTKTQSSRWQQLAALPKEDQEAKITGAKKKAEAVVANVGTGQSRAKKTKAQKFPRAIGPLDRCTAAVRAVVREIMREVGFTRCAELFVALRDELDDLEKVALPGIPRKAAVTIDSGRVDAEDRLREVPREKWHDLMLARRQFMEIRLAHDCRCLVEFVDDAAVMYSELGFESVDDMIRNGYHLEPEEIDVAAEWLRLRVRS